MPVCAGVTVSLPLVALVPLQAPLAVQEVALVESHASVTESPAVMLLTEGVRVATGVAALTVTVADDDCE